MALCKSSDYFLPGCRNAALEMKEGPCSRRNASLAGSDAKTAAKAQPASTARDVGRGRGQRAGGGVSGQTFEGLRRRGGLV